MGILVPPPSPFAAASLAAEIRRAEAAEALLAPLASPSFTGTPTAPTAAALAGGVQIATNAYADASSAAAAAAAVAAELSRAETAEALALPLAGGTMSGVLAAAAGLQYNPAGVAATLVTAGTITPVAGVVTLPVTMAAAVTGIIIAPGTADGQVCNIINTSAFTLTFAVAGTSNVADGAGDVIAALSYAAFLWDATTSLWYRGW
jgi:hypothetical protein